MKKYVCKTCNTEWFSEEDAKDIECPMNEPRIEIHRFREVPRSKFTPTDYVTLWESELENANRHSLTDMPDIVYTVLIKHVKDRKIVTKILKDLYNIGVGI